MGETRDDGRRVFNGKDWFRPEADGREAHLIYRERSNAPTRMPRMKPASQTIQKGVVLRHIRHQDESLREFRQEVARVAPYQPGLMKRNPGYVAKNSD
jgi:hypothetical protein